MSLRNQITKSAASSFQAGIINAVNGICEALDDIFEDAPAKLRAKWFGEEAVECKDELPSDADGTDESGSTTESETSTSTTKPSKKKKAESKK